MQYSLLDSAGPHLLIPGSSLLFRGSTQALHWSKFDDVIGWVGFVLISAARSENTRALRGENTSKDRGFVGEREVLGSVFNDKADRRIW